MKRSEWGTYAVWILATEAVGLAAGILIREGVALYNETAVKPPLSPPAAVFPIVWTVLYALMGAGAARVSLRAEKGERGAALQSFWVQLAFNFAWSILFFRLRAYGISVLCLAALWVLILRMISSFRAIDPAAARWNVPYLVWVTFAGYLNAGVWLLNR